MQRILIFGNSGSGKTTLAARLRDDQGLAHLELAAPLATEAIFLNLPVAQCQTNARGRPWEPHKYPSPAAQDANLAMLVDWIAQYPERDDVLSLRAHRRFFEAFPGRKRELAENTDRLL